MMPLLFAGVLVLLIWGLWAKQPILRTVARFLTGVLTLASAAATVFFFHVGQKAHWTSDGPGMLLIMIGVALCGFLAFLFGALFLQSLTANGSEQHDRA
jgi:hypothetical protein